MAYTSLAELRALDGLGDAATFPDSSLTAGAAYAERTINRFCGTTFGDITTPAYDPFTVTLDGNGLMSIRLVGIEGAPVLYPRTITSATVNGVADSGIVYSLQPYGTVYRHTGVWSRSTNVGGQNVVIEGTAGVNNTTPEDIAWAARTLARFWVLQLHSRTPDRAINLTTPEGAFEVRAQAGGVGRPTPLPDVNATLNANRHQL